MALTQEQQNYLDNGGTLTNGQIPSTYAPTGQETLNSTNLAPSQPLNLPQAPQDTTNYAGVITSIPTFDQILSQVNQASPAEQTSQGLMSKILSSMQKLGGKSEAQLKAEQNAGLPGFQTQLTDINSQLQGLQKEALAIPLQIQEQATGRGVTAGGVAPIQNAQLRQNAIKSLTLSAIGQTLQGNIANAQAQADRAVQLEFAPIEAELNTLKTAYELNKDVLERQDKRKADMLNLTIQERSRALDQQKEDKKTVLGFIAEASKNGAPAVLVQRASELNDPAQALSVLSQYMSDPVAKEKALADIEKTRAETDKLNREAKASGSSSILTNPNAVKYSGALSVILGSTKLTKEQKSTIINSINNGEDPIAVIKNQAKDILGTDAKELRGYEVAKGELQNIQSIMNEYYANGGSTGIFSGNTEKVLGGLGGIRDPKLVDIATRLSVAIMNYRRAVTGTAASVQEDANITSVFPGINKSEGLNTAITNARIQSFDNSIDNLYSNALGQNAYNAIKQSEISNTQQPTQPSAQVYTVNGVNYVQGSDGKYYKQETKTETSTQIPNQSILPTRSTQQPTPVVQQDWKSMLPKDFNGTLGGFNLTSFFK